MFEKEPEPTQLDEAIRAATDSVQMPDRFNDSVYVNYRPLFRPLNPGAKPLGNPYRIALVPIMTNEKWMTGEGRNKEGGLIKARIVEPHASKISQWMAERIEAACKKKARVICCPEYCYPILCHDSLAEKLQSLSSHYECYIVAGSHVTIYGERQYNTALLFAPYQQRPYEIHKFNKAEHGREAIDRGNSELQVFCDLNTNFAAIICADSSATDVGKNIGVANAPNSRHRVIDLLIVISRDDSGKTQRHCLRISSDGKTCVLYVNDKATGGQCKAYVWGQDTSENLQELRHMPYAKECGSIYVYDLDWIDLRRRRLERLADTGFPNVQPQPVIGGQ